MNGWRPDHPAPSGTNTLPDPLTSKALDHFPTGMVKAARAQGAPKAWPAWMEKTKRVLWLFSFTDIRISNRSFDMLGLPHLKTGQV